MMQERRPIRFADTDAIRRDVALLRAGETHVGNWSLAQACWHLATALDDCLRSPARTEPTDSERAMQQLLIDLKMAGVMPAGLDAPPGTEPPADAGAEAIDRFLRGLDRLDAYHEPRVDFAVFGPVDASLFRDFVRIHSAHHLSFFAPVAGKESNRA